MDGLKFPFCFYEDRVEDEPGDITLLRVRFRHQLHPKIDTNKTYPKVDYYIPKYQDNQNTPEIDVWDDNNDLVCTVKMEIQVRPFDPDTK